MFSPDIFLYLYSKLQNREGIHPYIFTPFRRILRYITRKYTFRYFANTPIGVPKKQSDIIVSLTSFPGRIDEVYLVIESMLRQTVAPKRILLWLSKEQFANIELPYNLKSLENEIFNIRFVDGDIRSHKKYYYVFSEFPQNKVLIIDDDLFYPFDMIEKMVDAANKYPNTIICRFGSVIKYENDKILPYKKWWNEIAGECDNQNFFFGSGGGILLEKKMLYKDILNIDLAMQLTPLADDIWLNAMINLAGTPKYKIYSGLIMQIQEEQQYRLSNDNVENDFNTEQLYRIIGYYVNNNLNPFYPRK